jgi:hypothetical protein
MKTMKNMKRENINDEEKEGGKRKPSGTVKSSGGKSSFWAFSPIQSNTKKRMTL